MKQHLNAVPASQTNLKETEAEANIKKQYATIISAFHWSLAKSPRSRRPMPPGKVGSARPKAKIHYATLADALRARSSNGAPAWPALQTPSPLQSPRRVVFDQDDQRPSAQFRRRSPIGLQLVNRSSKPN
jgi:hypothetical protein